MHLLLSVLCMSTLNILNLHLLYYILYFFFLRAFKFSLCFRRVLLNSCTSVPLRMLMAFYFLNASHDMFLAQYLALCAREY